MERPDGRAVQLASGEPDFPSCGRVRLVSARGAHGVNSGVFSGGEFTVTQPRSSGGVTDLQLVGGDSRACGAASGSGGVIAARRLLRGNAHGSFRTRGTYASATVRGTAWLTEDRCDGTTLIVDSRGSVQTSDPHGFLDPGVLSLGAGDSALYFCNESGQPPGSSSCCTVAVSNSTNGQLGAGIINFGPETSYDLCFTEPSSTVACIPGIALLPPQPDGRRISAVVCTAFAGPGNYLLSWRVGGVFLGPPLTASSNKAGQAAQCRSFTG